MFGRHRIVVGLVNRTVRVLYRSINRIKLQRFIADIYQIMPFAGRYEYRMVRFRRPYIIKVFLAVAHHHFGLTLFDTQELDIDKVVFRDT